MQVSARLVHVMRWLLIHVVGYEIPILDYGNLYLGSCLAFIYRFATFLFIFEIFAQPKVLAIKN